MKRNKLLTFSLLCFLLIFIISIFKEDYLQKKNSINSKYIIELYKTNDLSAVNDKIKEYSTLSTIYNKKVDAINTEMYSNINSEEKYIIYIGSYTNREDCNTDLLDITNKYYSNAIAYIVDTISNTDSDYQRFEMTTNPLIIDNIANDFEDHYRIAYNTIIENHPLESFNSFPYLIKNDTVSCLTNNSYNGFYICKYKSNTGSFNGFIKSNALIKIDMTQKEDLVDSLEYQNSNLKDSIRGLKRELLAQQNIISKVQTCSDYNTLIVESISKDRIVYISTFGPFKKLLFDKKDRNKVGNNYYREIPNINKFKFYITDKKGKQILGSKNQPIHGNICSMNKIMVI